ncbi:ABC transporter ATP-binding protein [Flavobacterium sp. N3904]|uniref:ABC transporter ATP-binding protein n=1 Tax=Flavobacterium sp. N3904 TaxID=2986835 RepID=UPI0022258199|nr:ABC transporter ATP-binding protein [Flavobacterium sp. N3904]
MKDIILKAENISKQYRLGLVGTGTLSHDLNRWWHQIRGKEDPYLKIGDTNDRSTKGDSEYVWALQDINFEVERGEVLGIIGKNGAGKSTLLKILSRVTAPTTGSIKFAGRVASLLEVGTGFNGEMTGRENIFLNGAILGMTKKEIASKIDEIIDFSGCERYIDTPVKRYSSGMYVRLAFAVAAFLEPEILIIDEVLAVGDAEFQKKAIGKMQDISRSGGRTVLFVSHNMAAVKQLCNRGIVLEHGKVIFEGEIEESLKKYQILTQKISTKLHDFDREGTGEYRISSISFISNGDKKNTFFLGEKIKIELSLKRLKDVNLKDIQIIIGIYNFMDEGYLRFDTSLFNFSISLDGDYSKIICELEEPLNIKPDNYYINVAVLNENILIDYITNAFEFNVENGDYFNTGKNLKDSELSKVYYKHKWSHLK